MTIHTEDVLILISKITNISIPQLIRKLTLQHCDHLLADNLLNDEKHKETLRKYIKQEKWYPHNSE